MSNVGHLKSRGEGRHQKLVTLSNYKCMECCWETRSVLLFGMGIKKLGKPFKKTEALEDVEICVKSLY